MDVRVIELLPLETSAGLRIDTERGWQGILRVRHSNVTGQALGSGAKSFAEAAASMRESLARSSSSEVDRLSPKNRLAVSGNWCASSKITVLQAGSSSATPSSRSMTSAKKRW